MQPPETVLQDCPFLLRQVPFSVILPPVMAAAKLVRSRSPFFLSGLWQEKHLFSSKGRTWSA